MSSLSSPHASWRLLALVSHIPGLGVIRTWSSCFSALTLIDKGILILLSLLGLSLSGSLSFLSSWLSAVFEWSSPNLRWNTRCQHTLGLGIKRETLSVTKLITISWQLAFGLQQRIRTQSSSEAASSFPGFWHPVAHWSSSRCNLYSFPFAACYSSCPHFGFPPLFCLFPQSWGTSCNPCLVNLAFSSLWSPSVQDDFFWEVAFEEPRPALAAQTPHRRHPGAPAPSLLPLQPGLKSPSADDFIVPFASVEPIQATGESPQGRLLLWALADTQDFPGVFLDAAATACL